MLTNQRVVEAVGVEDEASAAGYELETNASTAPTWLPLKLQKEAGPVTRAETVPMPNGSWSRRALGRSFARTDSTSETWIAGQLTIAVRRVTLVLAEPRGGRFGLRSNPRNLIRFVPA
jgi:hypothetical protein